MSFFGKAKGLQHPIDLSIGLPYGEMTPEARDAAIEALKAGKTRYAPAGGMHALRARAAEKLVVRNKIRATADTTIITAGVSAGLYLAMAAVLDPGDEIIIPDPFFLAYRELAILLDAKPVFLDTYPDFELDVAKLAQLITSKTKAILINSPNNPSGSIYSKASLKQLAALCRANGLVVISDEVYEDFAFGGNHFSIGSIYQPTITLNGFSKNHAMTGLRMGYAHSTPEIILAMSELEQFVFFSNSSIAEHAALAALDVSTATAMQHYAKNRDYIVKNLHPEYERSSGEGSFFFFLKHPHLNGRELSEAALARELIVIPGDLFSVRHSHFRISYATDTQTLAEGIKILNSLI
jgi:aspartate/methionine/tyrosine aminotransferase